MCIRDSVGADDGVEVVDDPDPAVADEERVTEGQSGRAAVSYTHLRAHETVLDLVCRLLLEKKKKKHSAATSTS